MNISTKLSVKSLMVATLLSFFVTQELRASEVLDLAKANAKVDFHADGKIMKVHGENGKASGSLTIANGKVSGLAVVSLKEMTTGISLRDEHMKDKYLEVKKYPTATLEIVEIALPAQMTENFEAAFKGKLTIHGVAQMVSGVAKLSRSGSQLKGDIEFTTKISSHKIELPKYSGIVIKDEVKVKIQFDGQLKKGSAGQSVAKK